jgi:hypothetical protein
MWLDLAEGDKKIAIWLNRDTDHPGNHEDHEERGKGITSGTAQKMNFRLTGTRCQFILHL